MAVLPQLPQLMGLKSPQGKAVAITQVVVSAINIFSMVLGVFLHILAVLLKNIDAKAR